MARAAIACPRPPPPPEARAGAQESRPNTFIQTDAPDGFFAMGTTEEQPTPNHTVNPAAPFSSRL